MSDDPVPARRVVVVVESDPVPEGLAGAVAEAAMDAMADLGVMSGSCVRDSRPEELP